MSDDEATGRALREAVASLPGGSMLRLTWDPSAAEALGALRAEVP